MPVHAEFVAQSLKNLWRVVDSLKEDRYVISLLTHNSFIAMQIKWFHTGSSHSLPACSWKYETPRHTAL